MNVQLPTVPTVSAARASVGAPPPPEVRPATRTDLAAIRAHFETLDADGRRLRFHGAVHGVPDGVLRIFGETDPRRITRIALDGAAPRTVIGEAMLVTAEGSTSGELAISVSSRHRRIGVGERLLSSLIDAAAETELRSLHADVLAGNNAFVGLAESLGFEAGRHPHDPTLLRMTRAVGRRGRRRPSHRHRPCRSTGSIPVLARSRRWLAGAARRVADPLSAIVPAAMDAWPIDGRSA